MASSVNSHSCNYCVTACVTVCVCVPAARPCVDFESVPSSRRPAEQSSSVRVAGRKSVRPSVHLPARRPAWEFAQVCDHPVCVCVCVSKLSV